MSFLQMDSGFGKEVNTHFKNWKSRKIRYVEFTANKIHHLNVNSVFFVKHLPFYPLKFLFYLGICYSNIFSDFFMKKDDRKDS